MASSSNLTGRTLRAILWSSSGTGVQFFANVLALIVLARLLTPEDFGVVGAATTIIALVQRIALPGLGSAMVQRAELEETHLRTISTLAVLIGALMAGLVIWLAPYAAVFFDAPQLTSVLTALSLVLFLSAFSLVPEVLMSREMKFKRMSIVQSVSFLFGYAVVGIVLAWLGAGVWALVAAMIGQTLCEVILYTLMQPYPKRPQLNLQALRDVANHSAGFSVARLTQYFAAQGDNLIVGRWLGVDALGLYSRAFRFAALPANLLGDSAGTVLFAAMTKVQTEEMRMRNAFRQGTALTALVIMPLTAIAVILAPEFFVVVLGPQWSGAVLPFQILALGMFFRAAWKVGGSVVRAVGAVHQMSVASMVYAGLIVVGALVGQLYGLVGVSVGVTTAVVLYYFLQLFQVKRLIHIGWPEILSLHVPAFVTTILVLVVAWVAAGLARQFGLPEWLVIVATSAGVGAALLVSVWLMPKLVLGEENIAWLRVFARHLFGRKSPI